MWGIGAWDPDDDDDDDDPFEAQQRQANVMSLAQARGLPSQATRTRSEDSVVVFYEILVEFFNENLTYFKFQSLN